MHNHLCTELFTSVVQQSGVTQAGVCHWKGTSYVGLGVPQGMAIHWSWSVLLQVTEARGGQPVLQPNHLDACRFRLQSITPECHGFSALTGFCFERMIFRNTCCTEVGGGGESDRLPLECPPGLSCIARNRLHTCHMPRKSQVGDYSGLVDTGILGIKNHISGISHIKYRAYYLGIQLYIYWWIGSRSELGYV